MTAATTVFPTQSSNEKSLLQAKELQKQLLAEGIYDAKEAEFEVLRIANNTTKEIETFYIVATFDNTRRGDLISLGFRSNEVEKGKLLVIKKLMGDNQDQLIRDIERRFNNPNYPVKNLHIYTPVTYSGNSSNIIIYPYIYGIRLDHYFVKLKSEPDASERLEKFLNAIIQISCAGRALEEQKESINKEAKSVFSLCTGIWDFNVSNFIVQDNGKVVLIDYEDIDGREGFKYLIKSGLKTVFGNEDPSELKEISEDTRMKLNDILKSEYRKQNAFAEFSSKLLELYKSLRKKSFSSYQGNLFTLTPESDLVLQLKELSLGCAGGH